MATLPTGTVIILYTDVEGSTRRWEERPTAMRAAVTRHFELLRDVIGSYGGHVFRTQGDGLCAAFATARRRSPPPLQPSWRCTASPGRVVTPSASG